MSENSAEYRTMICLTTQLRLAVKSELISLSGSLLSVRLISPDSETELRNTSCTEAERSARLVELVQNKVRQNPRHYCSFIGILQESQDRYRDILQQLEHTYWEYQRENGKITVIHIILVLQYYGLIFMFSQHFWKKKKKKEDTEMLKGW